MPRRGQLVKELVLALGVVALVVAAGGLTRRARYRHTPHVTNTPPAFVDPDSPPFRLIESSAKAGLLHVHQKATVHLSLANVAPILQAMAGASVAVVDFDRDGWPDVYLTSAELGSRNALLRNNHDGTFTDVAERAGVAAVNETAGSLRAVFFDYDNDGFDDLLLTTTWCPRVFHNRRDGTFEEVPHAGGIGYCGFVTASNVVDYDGDGRLDVVIAGFIRSVDLTNPSTTDFMPSMRIPSSGGGPILVYHNEGNGRFTEVPGSLGIKSRGWTHAVGVYDLRATGKPDLYFATDWNFDQVYWSNGRGGFTDASDSFRNRTYDTSGMSAEIADLENDGFASIFVTEIYDPGHIEGQNSLWKMTADDTLEPTGPRVGLPPCGWSWGAKFVDLDNDTNLDLAVTNGLLSGNPSRNYWFEMDQMRSSNVSTDAQYWPPVGDATLAGHETKCVFFHANGFFTDISAKTDLGSDRSDGRGLAAIDLMNEGVMSLIEANVGQPAHFFRNVPEHHNHWIGFSLTGTRSNRDAFGTTVTVTLKNGVTQSRELEPANGYESESDARLLFGLGATPEIESVHVRWPLGAEEDLDPKELTLDRYHSLVEPQ